MHADATTAAGNGGAAAPAAAEKPAPSSMWIRRDDKLLEMLLWRWQLNPPWHRVAAQLGDKTPVQAFDRYVCLADELRLVMEAPAVETTPEWDLHEAAVAAPTGGEAPPAVEKQTPHGLELQQAAAAPAPPAGGETTQMAAAVVNNTGRATGGDAAMVTTAWQAGTPAPPPLSIGSIGRVKSKSRKPRKMRQSGVGPRKRAQMWTTQEHSQFLHGLGKYGKGKWKTLAREFVKTKNSTQIASHYQKFCLRKEKRKHNECKRASIHDITDPTSPAPAPATTPASATGRMHQLHADISNVVC